MPSSYTSSLRLVLPVTGELSGTWGDVVNAGLTSLVEAAVAGRATVTHNDAANYTLTTANGAADEARNMFLNITGTLTAARNVVCPTQPKLYFIKNATTGGFSITLKTSGGTGISIPNGSSMVLACDGTDVVDAFSYFSGNIGGNAANVTGTVAVANGGTGGTTQATALQGIGALAADTQAKTGAYTVVAADRGDVLLCTNTWTLSLTAAATLGDGFSFGVRNTGTGTITIDPNGAETIDGQATKAIAPNQSAFVICDGTNWSTVGLSATGATGGGANAVFYENDTNVTVDYTITSGKNALSAGPITVDNGITVTVPSGSVWTIV